MRYFVRIYHYGNNYSAMVPDLPGCVAAADTIEQLRKLMSEAIALHLDMLRQTGDKVPAPSKRFDWNVEDYEEEELCTWIDVAKLPIKRKLAKSAK